MRLWGIENNWRELNRWQALAGNPLELWKIGKGIRSLALDSMWLKNYIEIEVGIIYHHYTKEITYAYHTMNLLGPGSKEQF